MLLEAVNLAPILAALHRVASRADDGLLKGEKFKLKFYRNLSGKRESPLVRFESCVSTSCAVCVCVCVCVCV